MKDNKPHFVKHVKFEADDKYRQLLQSLKERYRSSQAKAAVLINSDMLEFYWSLDRDIVGMKSEQRHSSGFFNQLSLDMKEEFPNTDGFSVTNLKYMKRWYAFYADAYQIRQRASDDLNILRVAKSFEGGLSQKPSLRGRY